MTVTLTYASDVCRKMDSIYYSIRDTSSLLLLLDPCSRPCLRCLIWRSVAVARCVLRARSRGEVRIPVAAHAVPSRPFARKVGRRHEHSSAARPPKPSPAHHTQEQDCPYRCSIQQCTRAKRGQFMFVSSACLLPISWLSVSLYCRSAAQGSVCRGKEGNACARAREEVAAGGRTV
jgi:hypothetical protein